MKTKLELIKTIELESTKGTKLIRDARYVFSGYISSGFDEYIEKSKATGRIQMNVSQMMEDSTFKDMFPFPEKQLVTQEQIIEFCKNYKDLLRKDGYATFFLFKNKGEFFVARVGFGGDGRLEVGVSPFSSDGVWGAECQYLVVSPQLDSESLSSEKSLESLDTLTLDTAIKICKEDGLEVIKKM